MHDPDACKRPQMIDSFAERPRLCGGIPVRQLELRRQVDKQIQIRAASKDRAHLVRGEEVCEDALIRCMRPALAIVAWPCDDPNQVRIHPSLGKHCGQRSLGVGRNDRQPAEP